MTTQTPVRTTKVEERARKVEERARNVEERARNVEEHTLAEVLTGLRDHGPATVSALAALIATMETLPQTEVRRIAAAAVVAERLASGLGRPDLERRARLLRAHALHDDLHDAPHDASHGAPHDASHDGGGDPTGSG